MGRGFLAAGAAVSVSACVPFNFETYVAEQPPRRYEVMSCFTTKEFCRERMQMGCDGLKGERAVEIAKPPRRSLRMEHNGERVGYRAYRNDIFFDCIEPGKDSR